MSVVVHAVIIAAVMIIPLVATDVLPAPAFTTVFIAPSDITPPPPPPALSARSASRPSHEQTPSPTPIEAPTGIVRDADREPTIAEVPGTVAGEFGGVSAGIFGDTGAGAAPPPPPVRVAPPPEPQHIGGNIRPPAKVRDVLPIYPTIAQAARVQGVVIIEATIGPDGHVQAAKVLRSIPLLDQAAIDAVRQWQFTPTLLNGVPVPVIMTVTVNFTLR
jgi:protein TonB